MSNLNYQQPTVRRNRGKQRLARITGLLVAFIAGGIATPVAGAGPVSTMGVYAPKDLVYGDPISAIHEMGPSPGVRFPPKDQPQPRIVVPAGIHDFGFLGPKDVVTKAFVIRNSGKAPLVISRAYTTCGCTTAEITARVIPPGKAVLATLKFDAGFHDARGKYVQRGLIIESNDSRLWKAEIWTRAAIRWY